MGGIEFEYKGKVWSICLEGGCIPFGEPEELKAFSKWLKTAEGKAIFGSDAEYEYDGSDSEEEEDEAGTNTADVEQSEEYLSDEHPFDPEIEDRKDSDNIMWYEYEKCRYGCYRHFKYKGKHDCAVCGVISCAKCAGSGEKCRGCQAWICGFCLSRTSNGADCPSCRVPSQEEAGSGG